MRIFWILAMVFVCLLLQQTQKAYAADSKSGAHEVGTESRPFIVKSASAQTDDERAHEKYEKQEKPGNERKITMATIWLAVVTALLAVFTGGLWLATYLLGREAKRTSTQQANDVQASIDQATRSAVAMEKLADAMTVNVQLVTKLQENLPKQMRAYVHVNIGTAFYQSETSLFQGRPVLENSGFTPARNVCFSINANIYDANIPNNFIFPAPHFAVNSTTGMSPRQTFSISSPTIARIPNSEVEEVMRGNQRRVFVWGQITYEDVFGQGHFTNFCYSIFFVPDGHGGADVHGNYHPANNDAT